MMVLVLEGLPYAAAPEMMQKWLRELIELRPRDLRIFGIISVICGLILCWIIRQSGNL